MPDLENPNDPKDSAKFKAVLVLVACIAFVLSPFLAQPFTGFDPAQMPLAVDKPPIQPAGYAFSIWGRDLPVAIGFSGFWPDPPRHRP